MLARYFRHLGMEVVSKLLKWLLVAAIGYITWTSIISSQQKTRGKHLLKQGQQLYNESEKVSVPTYQQK
ncbi:MAG: hypothetical protein ACTTKN_11250 [Phocaeicola sp.]|uniref:hypothetical protein n=1 Tax=Phocaeicola sp. TaxID=2773926 RepID=UPI003FA03A72